MLSERDKHFFMPRWRRVLTLLLVVIWAASEWYFQQGFWAVLTTALAGWIYWQFFVRFDDTN